MASNPSHSSEEEAGRETAHDVEDHNHYGSPSESAAEEAGRALAAIYAVSRDYDPDYRRYLESLPVFARRVREEAAPSPSSAEVPANGEQRTEGGGEGQGDQEEDRAKGAEIVRDGGKESEGSSGLGKQIGAEFDRSLLPNCPICYEPWTSVGLHRVCCIPCGHVYGRSCLVKWLQRCGNNTAKCPQCSKMFKLKEIILLYAPLIVAPNDGLQKEFCSLYERNESLHLEIDSLRHNEHDQMATGTSSSPASPSVQREDAILRETVHRIIADHDRLWTALEDLERRTTNLEERLHEQTQIQDLDTRLMALETRAEDFEQRLEERMSVVERLSAALQQYESEATHMRELHDAEIRALRERVEAVERCLDQYILSSSRSRYFASGGGSSTQGQRRVRRRRH